MPVYLITPLAANFDKLGKALHDVLPAEDVVALQARAGYLASYPGTSVDLSHKLGITSPESGAKMTIGSAMVTSVGAYYGRGPTPMWEWLKLKFERS